MKRGPMLPEPETPPEQIAAILAGSHLRRAKALSSHLGGPNRGRSFSFNPSPSAFAVSRTGYGKVRTRCSGAED